MSFTNVFGGSTLQAAQVAYRAVALAANVTLTWPDEATDENYVARIMDVTPVGPGYAITMPPANQVSTGMDFFVRNLGADTISILNSAGGVIGTVAAGTQRYFYCTENSTEAGTWGNIIMGVGSATLDAASLAGYGVKAIAASLNLDHPVSTVSANFSIIAADRAKVYVWTGGTGTITLPTAAVATNGFSFQVRNAGTGVLTIAASGGETIDAAANITLQVNESCVVHGGGATSWYTVGRGRNTQFNFTQLVKNVTGGAVTLTQTEAANVVQKYQGVLVSNCEVTLPSVVQVYYVSNATSGAFTLTFKCGGGTTVTVPQGQNAILFADGTNVINASTTVAGIASLTLNQGTVGSPSINYSGDATTGFYQPAAGSVAVAISGVQRLLVNNTGLNNTALGATTPSTGAFTTLSTTGAVTHASAPTVGGVAVALLASPALTGTPTAPTAAPGTNTTQLATTAFVTAAIGGTGFAPTNSPAFTGVPTAPTAAPGTNTTQLATTAFVQAAIGALGGPYAPINSPTFTGVPAAPTAAGGTSSTQIATTAFVANALGSYLTTASAAATYAPIANPNHTGSMTVAGSIGTTNGTIRSGGASGGQIFGDRTAGIDWMWYGTGNIARLWHSSSSDRVTIDSSGNFVAVGNVTAYSDVRVKAQITPMKDALTKIERVVGYQFWRTDIKQWQDGFIAQEIKRILPHSVMHDEENDRYSVSLAGPLALLYQGVNELHAKMRRLEARMSRNYH